MIFFWTLICGQISWSRDGGRIRFRCRLIGLRTGNMRTSRDRRGSRVIRGVLMRWTVIGSTLGVGSFSWIGILRMKGWL